MLNRLSARKLDFQSENSIASWLSLRYGRHMMFAFTNTKGGVGKSTLAVHLAVWLHDRGCPTAFLDTDKQRSSAQWLSEAEPNIPIRVADTPEKCVLEARALAKAGHCIVADGPAGLDDLSRALLILTDYAFLPIAPSILDIRSVQQAMATLQQARGINSGHPEWFLLLNKIRLRDRISRELQFAAPKLGIRAASHFVRDLQAFRDAPQQGTVVTRMKTAAGPAAADILALFEEIIPAELATSSQPTKRKGAHA